MEHLTDNSYQISPLQLGMILDGLRGNGSGLNVEQLVCSLHEEIDPAILAEAAQEMVQRHDVLRTSFHWEGLPEPRQKVQPDAGVSLGIKDWRADSAATQGQNLRAFLATDRAAGFRPDRAPLTRFTLLQLAEREYKLIWTVHHAVVDGRSFVIILDELFRWYDAKRRGERLELPPARPYREFIEWLGNQDPSGAERFWKDQLRGFRLATPIVAPYGTDDQAGFGEEETRLPQQVTASLRALAEREGFTLNNVVQGAWALLLSRYTASPDVVFGVTRAGRHFSAEAPSMAGTFINTLPVRVVVPDEAELFSWLRQIRANQVAVREYEQSSLAAIQSWSEVPKGAPLFESILVFENFLLGSKLREQGSWLHRDVELHERTGYPLTLYAYAEPELILKLAFDRQRANARSARQMLEHLRLLLASMAAGTNPRLAELSILSRDEEHQLLTDWNATRVRFDREKRIHDLIEEQARQTPHACALAFRGRELTYHELNAAANQLANHLAASGIEPGARVGVCLRRSTDLMIALLAILKAGAAYVPLDPAYPAERIQYVISDAALALILTEESLRQTASAFGAPVVVMDTERPRIAQHASEFRAPSFRSEAVAYVIYTSGSTGQPKGVMVTHRNVLNFFAGMDRTIGQDGAGVWLAVTSISFDISVLELFWTLSRGFQVVLQEENIDLPAEDVDSTSQRPVDFSLFYFASEDSRSGDPYRLLIEGAKFADQAGFRAIWTPERHFHAFGGLFPNPAVTSAALAMITNRVQIRAGSVVLPLHDPVRVAEEWAVVDQLSNGRVGVSFASGWHDRDFVLAPECYADRKNILLRDLETVRSLWRGESVQRRSGSGKEVAISILPRPRQAELPVWITAGGDPATFQAAGEAGANLLTHLLGQSLEDLRSKVAIYRAAFAKHDANGGAGHVTLMLHTFVGESDEQVEQLVRKPFCDYLKSSIDLMRQVARGLGEEFAGSALPEEDLAALIDHAFHRYFHTSGLFGSPETCLRMVRQLQQTGVDEIACLVDFGVDTDEVVAGFENLRRLAAECRQSSGGYSIPEQIVRRRVTHMQCTPSLARMLTNSRVGRGGIGRLRKLLVGGEALPPSLAAELRSTCAGEIYNMYGPTETTIWSTVDRVDGAAGEVTIGRPIANTTVFVLDSHQRPVPIGVSGELYIGGEGVVPGYWNRPELTAQRFVPLPYPGGERVYRTGDLVKYLPDGRLQFLGRVDHQVKIRGHRVELGEIEAIVCQHPQINQAVVTATAAGGEGPLLVAYLVQRNGTQISETELRQFLGTKLPSYMVPNAFTFCDSFPLTPNGKIDRNHLPTPQTRSPVRELVAPRTPVEQKIVGIWKEVLHIESIGIHDNFFDLGGHSLSAVSVTSRIRSALSIALPLQAVLDNPTVSELANEVEKLAASGPPKPVARPSIAAMSRARKRAAS